MKSNNNISNNTIKIIRNLNIKNNIKNLIGLILILFLTTLLILFANWKKQNDKNNKSTRYDFVMGTSMSQQINDKNSQDIMEDIYISISKLDTEILSWRSDKSELSVINNNYDNVCTYTINNTLGIVIEKSLEICKDSNGSLDITVHPLLEIWGIEENDLTIPNQKDIDLAKKEIGYNNINIIRNANDFSLSFINPVTLDFGAIGKGYALDISADILCKYRVKNAIISVGGSILVFGEKNDKSPWSIAIRDPRGEEEDFLGTLNLSIDDMPNNKMTVSTSGDYEKFIIEDGVRYHHIVDPKTGYPARSGLISVTVICEEGLISDGLSTACFVLGYEKSLPLLQKYNAEAIFVDDNGNIMLTENIKDKFKRK